MTLVPANWSGGSGTGYYPPGMKHYDLVERLLMYYTCAHTSEDQLDIPYGNVMGQDVRDPNNLYPVHSRQVGLMFSQFQEMKRDPRHD